MIEMDDDAFNAAVELIGRTGANAFEIGFAREDVPVEQAGWYAQAQYRGARIIVEEHRTPVEAAEALARRLLTGGRCTHCRGTITLSDRAPTTGPACRWTRQAARWERGCLESATEVRTKHHAYQPKRKRKKRRNR